VLWQKADLLKAAKARRKPKSGARFEAEHLSYSAYKQMGLTVRG